MDFKCDIINLYFNVNNANGIILQRTLCDTLHFYLFHLILKIKIQYQLYQWLKLDQIIQKIIGYESTNEPTYKLNTFRLY